MYVCVYTDTQWRNLALIMKGGGGRHSGEVPTILGGIQATISHPSKFGGGTIPPVPPPGNCAYALTHTHPHAHSHIPHIHIY